MSQIQQYIQGIPPIIFYLLSAALILGAAGVFFLVFGTNRAAVDEDPWALPANAEDYLDMMTFLEQDLPGRLSTLNRGELDVLILWGVGKLEFFENGRLRDHVVRQIVALGYSVKVHAPDDVDSWALTVAIGRQS